MKTSISNAWEVSAGMPTRMLSGARFFILSTLAISWASALPSIEQEVGSDGQGVSLEERLDQLASAYSKEGLFQGTVLVASHDRVLLRKGYGLACAEHEVPNTPETRFRLASVTKPVTATAVLRLVEQGLIDLRKPISHYLPKLKSSVAERVTMHELLSHSSGIIRDVETLTSKTMTDEFSIAEMVELIAGSTTKIEPGGQFSYSNAGYVLCAATIEAVTGQSYGDAMRRVVFDPLQMGDTGNEITGSLLAKRAFGYVSFPDGLLNAPPENKSYVTGAGSLFSTVDDLAKWVRALLDRRILSDSYTKRMFEPHAGKYGYGWFIGDGFGPFRDSNPKRGRVIHMDGGCPGFSTQVIAYLDEKIVVVALANARPSRCGELAGKLGDMVLGLSPAPLERNAGPEIYRTALGAGGLAAAKRGWEELRAAGRRNDLPSARQINLVGYRYLQANRASKAITIFRLLTELYPDNANGFDSLAEAYMTAGDANQAVRFYRKALAMNRANTNARKMLTKLGATAE